MARKSTLVTRLTDFFERIGRRRLWIQTHDIPDPDAIASAEAFRLIAKHFGKSAKIVTNGLPNRRENNALIRECRIHLTPLESVSIRSRRSSAWAYLDCLPGNGNVTLHPLAPGDIYFAIDHHGRPGKILTGDPNAIMYIDRTVGATATILTKGLLELGIGFPPRLASALSYAIITDTQDFSRGASEPDIMIYSELFHRTNQRIMSRLRNVTQPRDYFRRLHTSLENAYFYRHVAWVDIGEVRTGESVAETADFILSCERITWALAVGRSGDRLFLSMRSSKPDARCHRVIARIIRPLSGAVAVHSEMAGGFVRIGEGDDSGEIAEGIVTRFLRTVMHIPKSAENPEGTLLISE